LTGEGHGAIAATGSQTIRFNDVFVPGTGWSPENVREETPYHAAFSAVDSSTVAICR